MKVIMVMYDSLNRHMLSPYGCDWTYTPNFERLSKATATFENSYVGSMPCMPARRELHTGRYNFLHRSWGPLEPFDDSMPEILKNNNITSHLISDHYHYWEDGGCTYHTRYNSWEISRGQEGDPWKCDIASPNNHNSNNNCSESLQKHDWINRKYMDTEDKQPQSKTFKLGIDFLENNHNTDNWFLQLETFDPHDYNGPHHDWPTYGRVSYSPNTVEHLKNEKAALISMCDYNLGKILDFMDAHEMWDDTMLIVNTDHGFLLGEHECLGKCVVPFYNEVAHTPLFIWDPRSKIKEERRKSLVQTIDIPATILDFFNIALPTDMQGIPLKNTIKNDTPIRDAALFGNHGSHINCTDGQYVYMRSSTNNNNPLYEYTLMPTHMNSFFALDDFSSMELSTPFSFSKGCKLMKIKCNDEGWSSQALTFGSMLFDLINDPLQENPIDDKEIEKLMTEKMMKLMKDNDCPQEQYLRLGLV